MKGLLRIVVATIIVAILVIIPLNQYPGVAAAPSSEGKTVAVVSGEHSKLADLIAKHAGLEVVSGVDVAHTADVVVFSDMNSQAISAIERGAITVIAGALGRSSARLPMPVLTVSTERISVEADAETGTLLPGEVLEERIIVPEYSVCIFQDGEVSWSSYYAVATDSPEQYDYVSELAAQKVASILLEAVSLNQATSEWTKKYDNENLIILNEGGDQAYTRYEIYQLNYWDEVSGKEYWRVDSYIDHLLQSYSKTQFFCGPYMNKREVFVNAASPAQIYKYGPPTTPGDYGASVSVGFTVTTGGAGVNIGYSWSWSNPGVTYQTTADYQNSDIKWVEQFQGPNYSWYPLYYSGPTPAAYNSYAGMPSVVMRTPKGSGFSLPQLKSSWRVYRDFLLGPWGIWRVSDSYTWTSPYTILSSMFRTEGGGCPFLQVWDGSDYAEEGLLDIHNAEGVDVTYEHTLTTVPEPLDGTYAFRLVEHPKTVSHIDQVQLYAILEDGTTKGLPLRQAWHSEDGNVRQMLLDSDDWRVELRGALHNDGTSQSIDLKFASLHPKMKVVAFVFRIEGNNMICKIC